MSNIMNAFMQSVGSVAKSATPLTKMASDGFQGLLQSIKSAYAGICDCVKCCCKDCDCANCTDCCGGKPAPCCLGACD